MHTALSFVLLSFFHYATIFKKVEKQMSKNIL